GRSGGADTGSRPIRGSSGSTATTGCTTASAIAATATAGLSRGSVPSDRAAQRGEALVPAPAHLDEPFGRVAERLRRDRVAGLTADACRAQEPGVGERAELFRHRLPRHRELRRELGRGRRPAFGHGGDERTAPRIAERVEDELYLTGAHANCGDVSVTCTRVPPSTSSSSSTTSPPSSQSRTRRSSGSASRTTARR